MGLYYKLFKRHPTKISEFADKAKRMGVKDVKLILRHDKTEVMDAYRWIYGESSEDVFVSEKPVHTYYIRLGADNIPKFRLQKHTFEESDCYLQRWISTTAKVLKDAKKAVVILTNTGLIPHVITDKHEPIDLEKALEESRKFGSWAEEKIKQVETCFPFEKNKKLEQIRAEFERKFSTIKDLYGAYHKEEHTPYYPIWT
jgi:hypothetical protein